MGYFFQMVMAFWPYKNYISFFSLSAKASKLSREERLVLCISDIINELIIAHQEGKDVNLNKIKTRLSSKYAIESQPRLVDIIAAVPHDHKKTLIPKLKAKPVRTASGVSCNFKKAYLISLINHIINVLPWIIATLE